MIPTDIDQFKLVIILNIGAFDGQYAHLNILILTKWKETTVIAKEIYNMIDVKKISIYKLNTRIISDNIINFQKLGYIYIDRCNTMILSENIAKMPSILWFCLHQIDDKFPKFFDRKSKCNLIQFIRAHNSRYTKKFANKQTI